LLDLSFTFPFLKKLFQTSGLYHFNLVAPGEEVPHHLKFAA